MLNVLEIRSMAIHNGPGNRTMVHFMGCPLKCYWCSTPESQSMKSQLGYKQNICILCGSCMDICPKAALSMDKNAKIYIDRKKCFGCMKCTQECPTMALEQIGKPYTVQEIYREIMADKFSFGEEGGVTFSGGEILMSVNEEFLTLCHMLRENGISIGIDTSGYASEEILEQVLPVADFFLWDIKQLDDKKHQMYTGVSNERIIQNLDSILSKGAKVYIRYPLIPGMNDSKEDMERLLVFLKKRETVAELHILPFHHLGTSRYMKIGKKDVMEDIPVFSPEQLETYRCYFKDLTIPVKIVG